MTRCHHLPVALAAAVLVFGSLALAVPAAKAQVAAMPLTVMPVQGSSDTVVIMYSGDGGWAAIDHGMAASFNAAGLPVVGVNSLGYFLTRRTPQVAAADLAALIDEYAVKWGKRRVILAGYSFGADALPAIVARLPAATRAKVRLLALVALSNSGELQFHPADWLNKASPDAYPMGPALAALRGLPMVCVYGASDRDDACPTFQSNLIRQESLPGDHHFNEAYGEIVRAILQGAH
jgi:type IV secretory pathway VirJ component